MTREQAKRLPEVAEQRSKMAQGFRKMRKDNPALARLAYRQMKRATADLTADFDRLFWGTK